MSRGLLISVHIADIHFAAFNPQEQYEILSKQFLSVIDQYPKIDIISIDGDIFHHKLMGNSEGLYYASMFIDDIINIAIRHNSTVVILHGTYSHDADQLKNFYHYMRDKNVDVRIDTNIGFEDIKGAKILCIPEQYGIPEEEYYKYLHQSGYYDEAFMHGTFEGCVYGNNVGNGRLFRMMDFDHCCGFIIGGHVHTPGCHSGYFYYCGSPYRWKFGEEEDKGFLITIHDLDSHRHYVHFNKIISNRYITMTISDLMSMNPKQIIDYINNLQQTQGIEYLKIKFNVPISGPDKVIIDNYYRNNSHTFVEFLNLMEEKKLQEGNNGIGKEYDFILNNSTSDFEKFVRYVNMREGSEFITVDKLKSILAEQI